MQDIIVMVYQDSSGRPLYLVYIKGALRNGFSKQVVLYMRVQSAQRLRYPNQESQSRIYLNTCYIVPDAFTPGKRKHFAPVVSIHCD